MLIESTSSRDRVALSSGLLALHDFHVFWFVEYITRKKKLIVSLASMRVWNKCLTCVKSGSVVKSKNTIRLCKFITQIQENQIF